MLEYMILSKKRERHLPFSLKLLIVLFYILRVMPLLYHRVIQSDRFHFAVYVEF